MEKLNVAKAKKAARPQSARSARSYEEEKKKRRNDDDSKSSASGSESDDSDDDDECWEDVDAAKTVEEGMYALWKNDPETFYTHGEAVERMLRYKLERGWSPEDLK